MASVDGVGIGILPGGPRFGVSERAAAAPTMASGQTSRAISTRDACSCVFSSSFSQTENLFSARFPHTGLCVCGPARCLKRHHKQTTHNAARALGHPHAAAAHASRHLHDPLVALLCLYGRSTETTARGAVAQIVSVRPHKVSSSAERLLMSILFPLSRGPRLRPGFKLSQSGAAMPFSSDLLSLSAPLPAIFANSAAISMGDRRGNASLNGSARRASSMNSGGAVSYEMRICSLSLPSAFRSLKPSDSSSLTLASSSRSRRSRRVD